MNRPRTDGIDVIFKMSEECSEHLLSETIKERFENFTDIDLINNISNKILKRDIAEISYFYKIVKDLMQQVGLLSPTISGKKLYYIIYHLYNIDNKVRHSILESWCNRFYERYIVNNKIQYNKEYVIFKIREDNKFDLIPFEVENDNGEIKFIEV